MMVDNSNKAIFKFHGRSSGGVREYSILCNKDSVRSFWAGFAVKCVDLDNCSASIVRQFLGLACREEPTAMLEERGEGFLLTPESLWEWFAYWKRLELPFPTYVRRYIVYIAVYAARYCLSSHTECSLDSKLVRLIRGKELATFLLNDWTAKGLVGVMTTSDGNRTLIKEFRFTNKDLARIYIDYFESGIATVRASEFNHFADSFEASLGLMAEGIHGYGDFSEASLLRQVEFYRQKFLSKPSLSQKALRHIVGFYRFIINTEQGCGIMDEGNFSAGLLRNMSILRFLSEGWEYVHYKALDLSESRPRLVIILKDMARLGTRYVNGDALAFDLSKIESEFYRNLVWRYLRSDTKALFGGSGTNYIVQGLHFLELLKRQTGKKLTVFTNAESRQIWVFYEGKKVVKSSLVMIFYAVRRFFSWANGRGFIKAESVLAINCLKYRSEQGSSTTKALAIPRQDYVRLIDWLALEGDRSYRAKLIYTIVILLSVTRFRPSQICIMDVQSIRLENDGRHCFVRGVSKVSNGDRSWSPVPKSVYDMLAKLINDSSEMRDRCFDPNIQDKVFLYEADNGFDFLRETDVKQAMEQACNILELPHWTPYNIRKMYATAWDEVDRQLGYHGELAAQAMGHRSYNTTRRHYIDRSFEEFQRAEGANMFGSDEMMRREYEELLKEGQI